MDLFFKLIDINFIILTVLDYELSLIELVGVISGLACVWLTAKEKIICWPVGILNILCFLVMFFQIQLYSDALLQIFFLVTTIYGWYSWANPRNEKEKNKNNELKISFLTKKGVIYMIAITIVSTVVLGLIMRKIHIFLPIIFKKAASFPFGDAFTTIASVVATFLMTRKKADCWLFWVATDVVATVIYFIKGINLVAIEYIIFGLIALNGYFSWTKTFKSYDQDIKTADNEA
ncbi:MAG TPA: nicotinamide riboside transporter PnuC [Spirochaetota bacterium]|jgi:nicotinamide mononucleotide transporter|nr:MAG: Nicotinamide riboside transporter PnuC [Spirochaetes bacterium ADurb.Bin133]HNZ26817.1 nicotinamide riboside transporter PnuC [Spirochaetota bacterium]HPY88245.1 nicotinamide riboside transporter PnuC [Spirochaetota bacterium]